MAHTSRTTSTTRTRIGRPDRRTRVAAAAAGAALVAGATLTGALAAPAGAVPGTPATVFDPATVGWYSHRDQTSAAFAATFAAHSKAGYLPVDLEIDTKGTDYPVASVWQKNTDGRKWREHRDLTSAGFAAEWADARADGLRLVEQETYVVGGTRRYAGIWVANPEHLAWSSHRGQTAAQFVATFEANRDAGLMPVDFDQFRTSGGTRYSTVWVANPAGVSWKLYRNLTSADFSAKFAANADHRVLSFESLATPAGQRYGAIFVKDLNGRRAAMRRDMDARAYDNYWHRYADLGYRVVGVDKYETPSGPRYAVMWRQNSARPDWALRPAVDARVQSELPRTRRPGSASRSTRTAWRRTCAGSARRTSLPTSGWTRATSGRSRRCPRQWRVC